jgi:hypothetical protein
MRKFYLNNYKWLEILIAIIVAAIIFLVIKLNLNCSGAQLTKSLIKANDTVFAAIASLLGFVFATITILVGLGDNFRGNNKTNLLTKIIEKLVNDRNEDLTIEESEQIKDKHTATSLFFSTKAYSLTLKSLMGCVRVLGLSFILSLIVSIFGVENIVWVTIVGFYLALVLMTIIRILALIRYMIDILTNAEESDK